MFPLHRKLAEGNTGPACKATPPSNPPTPVIESSGGFRTEWLLQAQTGLETSLGSGVPQSEGTLTLIAVVSYIGRATRRCCSGKEIGKIWHNAPEVVFTEGAPISDVRSLREVA